MKMRRLKITLLCQTTREIVQHNLNVIKMNSLVKCQRHATSETVEDEAAKIMGGK